MRQGRLCISNRSNVFNSVFTLDRRKATKQRKRNLSSIRRRKKMMNNKNKNETKGKYRKEFMILFQVEFFLLSFRSSLFCLKQATKYY